jgi:hypothetical protein
MTNRDRDMYLAGVAFGHQQSESGRGLRHAIDEAEKLLDKLEKQYRDSKSETGDKRKP